MPDYLCQQKAVFYCCFSFGYISSPLSLYEGQEWTVHNNNHYTRLLPDYLSQQKAVFTAVVHFSSLSDFMMTNSEKYIN